MTDQTELERLKAEMDAARAAWATVVVVAAVDAAWEAAYAAGRAAWAAYVERKAAWEAALQTALAARGE